MTDAHRLTNAQCEIVIALDAAQVARAALALGIARDALSRAYYAVLQAVRALLLLDGLKPKTRQGVMRSFSDQWIKTGRIASSPMLVSLRLQSYRLASDYWYSFDVRPADAEAELEAAERFVEQASKIVAQGLSA